MTVELYLPLVLSLLPQVAPVSPDPAPKDSCEGGLAELVADSWSEHGLLMP